MHRRLSIQLSLLLVLGGCYSFRGGSVPAHLKTITIPQVDDQSGYGRGTVSQDMRELLIRKFRDDNSLRVIDAATADSRLDVVITSIRTDERLAVSASDLETDRRVLIVARVTFEDNVKRRQIYKDRSFEGFSQYAISRGEEGRNDALRDALNKLTDLILQESVADW